MPWIVGGAPAEPLRARVEARGGALAPADPVEERALVERMLRRPAPRRRARGRS